MRAIQQQLLNPRHTEVNRIFVKALPEVAWETVRHFYMASIPWVHLLFDIRTLPERLRGQPPEADRRLGVDQIADSGKGFMIVQEIPGREVVVASVGLILAFKYSFCPSCAG